MHTNGTPNGNHMHMARFHGTVKLDMRSRTALEGLPAQTTPSPKVLLLVPVNLAIVHVGWGSGRRGFDVETLLLGGLDIVSSF